MHREVGILNIVNSRFRLNHGLLIFWNNLPVRYPPPVDLCASERKYRIEE